MFGPQSVGDAAWILFEASPDLSPLLVARGWPVSLGWDTKHHPGIVMLARLGYGTFGRQCA